MAISTHTLLDRFLRYVRFDTTADDKSTTYPSSPGQLVLGAVLRDELLAMGVADARQTPHGYVFGTEHYREKPKRAARSTNFHRWHRAPWTPS